MLSYSIRSSWKKELLQRALLMSACRAISSGSWALLSAFGINTGIIKWNFKNMHQLRISMSPIRNGPCVKLRPSYFSDASGASSASALKRLAWSLEWRFSDDPLHESSQPALSVPFWFCWRFPSALSSGKSPKSLQGSYYLSYTRALPILKAFSRNFVGSQGSASASNSFCISFAALSAALSKQVAWAKASEGWCKTSQVTKGT